MSMTQQDQLCEALKAIGATPVHKRYLSGYPIEWSLQHGVITVTTSAGVWCQSEHWLVPDGTRIRVYYPSAFSSMGPVAAEGYMAAYHSYLIGHLNVGGDYLKVMEVCS